MKLYQDLNQHRAVRGAVKLLSGIVRPKAVHSSADAKIDTVVGSVGPDERAARTIFREQFYDEVLKHAERLQPLAAAAAKSISDPLGSPDVLAYALALRTAANKFAFTHECAPDQFLTASEVSLCETAAVLDGAIAEIRECVEQSAADMKLDSSAERSSTKIAAAFQALRVLALYRHADPDQRDRVFELLEYSPPQQIGIVAKLVEYMELGFSRAESLEWLRRHGAPAWLAQRAVAAHVCAQIGSPSDSGARSYAQILDGLHLKEDMIKTAWIDAGFEPSLIEAALAIL